MPRSKKKSEREQESQRLLTLRNALGLTQREMAETFGVAPGAIAQWEGGERTLPGPVLKLIEIYEAQVSGIEPKLSSAGIPSSYAARSMTNARAAVMWGLVHGSKVFSTSPVAERVRMAALRRFSRALGELKGLSMKLGQMTSFMDFALSDEERAVLRSLQSEAKPMNPLVVCEVLLAELGGVPRELFLEWSSKPVASASIGQVHQAVAHSGERLAVKVQYPRLVEILKSDLRNVGYLDRALTMIMPGQRAGVLYEEMRARVLEECDYVLEARHQRDFARAFAHRRDMRFAEIVDSLSTSRVLTATWLDGNSFDDFVQSSTQEARDRAASTLWDFHYESMFRHGMFNTDPHPGNYLFCDDAVCFLDFGRVKRYSPEALDSFRRLMRALLERDLSAYRRDVIALGCAPDPSSFDFHYSYRAMLCFFRPYLTEGPFTFDIAFLRRLWEFTAGNVNHFRINYPAELVFIDQLHFGVGSLFARMNARIACRDKLLSALYERGEPTPPPFTSEELASLQIGP